MQDTLRPKKRSFIDKSFAFSHSLKQSDRLILKLTLIVFVCALWLYAIELNNSNLVEVPHRGGTLTEGVVGTPRFVNPLLAVTNADKDAANLVYSGLMKLGAGTELEPDMAESVTVSADGLTYNVILKNDLTFHDGVKVTTDDVITTITRIQDPAIKSPLLGSWEGVTMERISDREMNFVLEKPYTPFIENLTVGILPHHIWEFASVDEFPFSQYNSEPIGSGPYKVLTITRSRSGIPESYILVPYEGYYGQKALISQIVMKFFPNEGLVAEALENKSIDAAGGLSPLNINNRNILEADHVFYTTPLPRTFTVFWNQNEAPLFRDAAVREALERVTDRKALVETVLRGYGTPVTGPIPPGFGIDTESEVPNPDIEAGKQILARGGWIFNEETKVWTKKSGDSVTELRFKLSTSNMPIFQMTADMLKSQWEALGVAVTIEKYEQTDLTQTIIRPRKYDALLFGTVVGRDLDLYSFWHTSQRNDPGLNVALYANVTTDTLLSEARTEQDREARLAKYKQFSEMIQNDRPALFLYAPSYVYILPKTVRELKLDGIAEPFERFARVSSWYIATESVWPFFK